LELKKEDILDIFRAMGEVMVVDEKDMNVVSVVTSCGVGVIGYVGDIMYKWLLGRGISADKARIAVGQMIRGTGTLIKEQGTEVVIGDVCTKGGATIKGIEFLKDSIFGMLLELALVKMKKGLDELGT